MSDPELDELVRRVAALERRVLRGDLARSTEPITAAGWVLVLLILGTLLAVVWMITR